MKLIMKLVTLFGLCLIGLTFASVDFAKRAKLAATPAYGLQEYLTDLTGMDVPIPGDPAPTSNRLLALVPTAPDGWARTVPPVAEGAADDLIQRTHHIFTRGEAVVAFEMLFATAAAVQPEPEGLTDADRLFDYVQPERVVFANVDGLFFYEATEALPDGSRRFQAKIGNQLDIRLSALSASDVDVVSILEALDLERLNQMTSKPYPWINDHGGLILAADHSPEDFIAVSQRMREGAAAMVEAAEDEPGVLGAMLRDARAAVTGSNEDDSVDVAAADGEVTGKPAKLVCRMEKTIKRCKVRTEDE